MLTAAFLLRRPLLTMAGSILVENDRPQRADAILVLGGDDFGTRIIKGAELAQAGYAPYVIVSGPGSLIGHESDMTIQYAVNRGYPSSLFRPLWHNLNSTRSETAFVGHFLAARGIQKVLLVTSNYHTRRAASLMRKQNPRMQIVVVAAPDPFFTADSWWKSRDGQKTFLFEWMKTVSTLLGN